MRTYYCLKVMHNYFVHFYYISPNKTKKYYLNFASFAELIGKCDKSPNSSISFILFLFEFFI